MKNTQVSGGISVRRQSVRAPIIRYTELEARGLVEALYEGDDLLRLLQERGFICVEGNVRSAPFRLMLGLEQKGIEYQMKSFEHDDFHPNPHSEFSLPYFIDDRSTNEEGFRVAREIKPPRLIPRNPFEITFSEASEMAPFLTKDNRNDVLQMIRTYGFVGTDELSYRLIHHLNLQKVEFMMRSYVDGKNVSYEFQLQSFSDDREDAD